MDEIREMLERFATRGSERGGSDVLRSAQLINLEYDLREGSRNLRSVRRQVTAIAMIVLAAILVAVVVFQVSSSSDTANVVASSRLHNKSQHFEPNESDTLVLMRADSTSAQTETVRSVLEQSNAVLRFSYESRAAAYRRWQEINQGEPGLAGAMKPGDLPASFRLVLVDPFSPTLERQLSELAGVDSVEGPNEHEQTPHAVPSPPP